MDTTPTQPTDTLTTTTGSAHVLRNWFSTPSDVSGPCDDEAREQVLADLHQFTAWACKGDTVAIRTAQGRALCTGSTVQGCPVVTVEYQRDAYCGLVRFWMNASSLRNLGNELRACPAKRTSLDAIWLGSR